MSHYSDGSDPAEQLAVLSGMLPDAWQVAEAENRQGVVFKFGIPPGYYERLRRNLVGYLLSEGFVEDKLSVAFSNTPAEDIRWPGPSDYKPHLELHMSYSLPNDIPHHLTKLANLAVLVCVGEESVR